MKKVLLTATVQSHIAQFHMPLVKMLKENGYEVHVAARNNLMEKNGLEIKGADKIFDIPFERSPLSKNNFRAYKQLKDILSYNSYDIVHCNTPMGGVVTRLAAKRVRKNGTKVFYTAHGFHFYKGAPFKNWVAYYPIEKWLANYTDKLITITKEDYKLASRKFRTNSYHVHGVGVNTNKYFQYENDDKVQLRKQLGYLEDQFLVLCIGELNKNKNQCTIIHAIAEIIETIPNIILLLAGNGPTEYELKEMVRSYKLESKVNFLGYRTDLETYINICDIVVSASFREGLPLNIMEAMLCKKPVITSVNRGHKELVQDGESGYLVNPSSSSQFAERIIEVLLDQEKRKRLGENGFKYVKTYTDENVIEELKSLYLNK